ncbi:MAG TPA: sialate O-acetylesterase [Steroidobacteraceae bacterium]|nr:sialate O-acetylesterase [Steroidobacteraceae bacterium]
MLQRMAARLAWVLGVTIAAGAAQAEAPLMSGLFVDHAVLQRDRPINVYGHAAPGESVTVSLAGASASAQADARGAWSLTLPAMPAGGPHALAARSASKTQTANDILVGDVWLCSGQSNMEWPVRMTLDAHSEAALSANDRIRHVTIARTTSAAPRTDFDHALEWKVAGPDSTAHFSATCYYFVRELQKTVNVPQGIISSNWGGSRIEPWMSEQALRALGGYQAPLELLGELRTNKSIAFWHWGETWQKWWLDQRAVTQGTQPWAAGAGSVAWQPAPQSLGHWETWGVPALGRHDGMVWFRARARLDKAQARQAAQLSLGLADDVDVTWLNGRAVGTGFGDDERRYALPPKLLKAGDNLVVVNVHDYWGNGGLHGPADQRALLLADGTRVPLTDWEYSVAPAGLWPPPAPWASLSGVSILYNAMIAPLGKYGLRGVAWYQGESNAGLDDARKYQALLAAWMADWRRQFDAPLPFLIVQLANHGALATAPVDSGWAQLRDAQRRAVAADGNAGLAVTIDIGNRDDIHPANKQDVGRRLARAARHVVYGEKISASGAQPVSAARTGGEVEVTLGDFDGNLLVIGARDPSGFELCGPTQASCRFVRAQLAGGGKLRLSDVEGAGDATRVRFCWADSPLCNLYDSTGLPVGPFEVPL